MCVSSPSRKQLGDSVVATTAIYYFDGRVSITQQNPREELSPATGSFLLSVSALQ